MRISHQALLPQITQIERGKSWERTCKKIFFIGKLLERMRGIEPPYAAWEAAVLPLNYIRLMRPLYCLPSYRAIPILPLLFLFKRISLSLFLTPHTAKRIVTLHFF